MYTLRAEHENATNQETLERVRGGLMQDAVKYGEVIQLMHVSSGLFLGGHRTAALSDPDCQRVNLGTGSYATQFTLVPRLGHHNVSLPLNYSPGKTPASARPSFLLSRARSPG